MHAVHAGGARADDTMDETVGKTAASKNGTLLISKTEVSDVDKGYSDWFKKVGNGTLPI